MNRERLRTLFEEVRTGTVTVDRALEQVRYLPFEDLGFATVDHHRSIRTGFPEVVFCQGKTADQVVSIATRIIASETVVLATRADEEVARAVKVALPSATHNELARTIVVQPEGYTIQERGRGTVLIISAGTSDLPVAEEAAVTAEVMGNQVKRLFDVGVAGIHRLLAHKDLIWSAEVIVVAAGMEGALASVVGGLVDVPVVAVPTSIGYGASFNGLAALLSMLNSCAAGVTVVNIDNGFGAGYAASLINRRK